MDLGLHSKTLSSFRPTTINCFYSAFSCHAGTKTVGSFTLYFAWLVRSFHKFYRFSFIFGVLILLILGWFVKDDKKSFESGQKRGFKQNNNIFI